MVAFSSFILFVATLLVSDWGFSTPKPIVRPYWFTLLPAVLLMLCWVAYPLLPVRMRRLLITQETNG
ncbi:conserved hypothetical protein, membrane [Rhodopirellula baltica WH47]|uniref:Uncharacterized protein n=1 Tax=Rhodopirellula baltica WH47 TaxID=991778 RepID=F2AR04_RHOBT|nr:conserved hypothetical protein, membrane [Rhodopirellula baltica WH47]